MNLPNSQFWFLAATHIEAVALRLNAQSERPREGIEPISKRPLVDYYGNEIAQLRMVGSVGIVPVKGPLLKSASGSDKKDGFASYEDVADDIDNAKKQGAKSVILDMATPGGMAVGAGELGRYVRDAGVRTVSFTDSLCCSAGEYLSAACDLRVATADAIVGSIGTVMTTASFQGMLEKFGIKATVFASGKYKAAGSPYKDLTRDQEDYLQGFVDTLAGEFKGWMSEHRPLVGDESMQGQVFTGKQAREIGLVDGVSAGMPALIDFLTRKHG